MKTLWIFGPNGWEKHENVREGGIFHDRDYWIGNSTGTLYFRTKTGTLISTSTFYIVEGWTDR